MTKSFSKMSRAEKKYYLRRRWLVLTFLVLPITGFLTYAAGVTSFKEILPIFLMFNENIEEISFSNTNFPVFGGFFPLASFFTALIIGIIKNNINNLKLEIYIAVSGAFVFFFFMFFSYPLMMSWAYIHH